MTARVLLERHPIFRSRDAEETRGFLNGKNYLCEFGRSEHGDMDTRVNGLYGADRYIGYVQYGALTVMVSPAADNDSYSIQIPVRGHLAATIGNAHVDCDATHAVIASPIHKRRSFFSSAGSARVQLTFARRAVIEGLAALLGETPERPLELATTLDLTGGHGRSLAGYVLMAALDLDRPDSLLMDARAMERFEQLIVTALLLSHEHNYAQRLRDCARAIAPRDVKRALDQIEANLDAPVTLADLVAASGVPGRTLFKHFRDSKGVSPMRHLRNTRFARAREALRTARDDESVTVIALSCGFSPWAASRWSTAAGSARVLRRR